MKKKTTTTTKRNAATSLEHCDSIASGGALSCVLDKGHTGLHSTTRDTRKSRQHATWVLGDDGQVAVIAYSRGKKMSEWSEMAIARPPVEAKPTAPAAKSTTKNTPCAAKRLGACVLNAGHGGDHVSRKKNSYGLEVRTWNDVHEGDPTHVRATQNEWQACPSKTANKGHRCERPLEHDTSHAAISLSSSGSYNFVSWADSAKGTPVHTFQVNDPAAALLNAKPKPLTLDDEPDDPEADEAALAAMQDADDEPEPRLTDLCNKCGHELGEHNGKKCPPKAKGLTPDQIAAKTVTIVSHALDTIQPQHEAFLVALRDVPMLPDEGDAKHNRRVRLVFDELVKARSSRIATSSPTTLPAVGETISCRGKVYPVHPAARMFGVETTKAQFTELLESMRLHGQIHDVERLDDPANDNPVIDGCSRLMACEILGIDPRVVYVQVENPWKYVIAVNLARRHMDESRRAMAAIELATMEHGSNQHTRTGSAAAPQLTQAEAATMMGVSERLVRDAGKVKREGVPEVIEAIREGKLKVSAGAKLAKLGPKQQREVLDKAGKGGGEIRSGKIAALVKQEEKRAIVRQINTGRVSALPTGAFGVILADYPWKYDNSDQHDGSRGHMGYPAMEFDNILAHAREVAKRAAKDCVIALWTTNLYIPRMQAVVDAFGAAHHSVFTWPKPRAGVGTWGRGQTEHLIIASIGTPTTTLNEVSTLLPSWPPAHPGEHSSKPAEVRDMLAKHCGGPFLELFAREEREGWTPWGAEVDKFSSEAA